MKKFMLLGMMVTINSVVDFQTAELIASELGVEIIQKLDKTSEEKLQEVQNTIANYSDEEAVVRFAARFRPTTVAVHNECNMSGNSLLRKHVHSFPIKRQTGDGSNLKICSRLAKIRVKHPNPLRFSPAETRIPGCVICLNYTVFVYFVVVLFP